MNKKEYGEFHRILAELKYDLLQDLFNENISETYQKALYRQIKAIDCTMNITHIEPDEKITIHSNN